MTALLVGTAPFAEGQAQKAPSAAIAAPAPPDPLIPTGPPYRSVLGRPADDPERPPACSFRHPVCVHARREASAGAVLGTLIDLERASAALVSALGMPAPLADGSLGGGPSFDVYLIAPASLSPKTALVATERDEPDPGARDRASAFALLRDDLGPGCVRANLAARALASAIGWGVDAAEDPAIRESNAAYLAELVAPCSTVTAELIDDFQAHPERALCAASRTVGPAVAVALPWYLDVALGTGTPGSVPMGLAMISGQRSPSGSLRWENEPDLFDALRAMLKARTPPSLIDDLWLQFAIARLFMGSRDDGVHFPETASAGSFGRIRFDWSISYSSLPRRLSPERPLEPTGSTYIWTDLRDAPPGTRLAFRMEWEAPVPFRWVLLRIGPDGSEVSRVMITPQQRSRSAEKNLDALDGLAGVALIGVNIGDLALDDPFDPDEAPYEPHGYVLTVASVPP